MIDWANSGIAHQTVDCPMTGCDPQERDRDLPSRREAAANRVK
jgi:hypothetical protein